MTETTTLAITGELATAATTTMRYQWRTKIQVHVSWKCKYILRASQLVTDKRSEKWQQSNRSSKQNCSHATQKAHMPLFKIHKQARAPNYNLFTSSSSDNLLAAVSFSGTSLWHLGVQNPDRFASVAAVDMYQKKRMVARRLSLVSHFFSSRRSPHIFLCSVSERAPRNRGRECAGHHHRSK